MPENPKCQYVETGYGNWFTNPVTGTQSWVPLRTSEKPCSGDVCNVEDLKDWQETADRWIYQLEIADKDDPAVQGLRAEFNAIQIPQVPIQVYQPFIDPYVDLVQRACAFSEDVGPGLPDECDPTEPPPHGYICVIRENRFMLERDPNIVLPPFTPRPIEPKVPAKKKSGSNAQTAVTALMALGVALGIVALRNRNQ